LGWRLLSLVFYQLSELFGQGEIMAENPRNTPIHGVSLMNLSLRKEADSLIRPREGQRSFCDADYIFERLIPQDSFYRKFREIVTPLLKDKQFESMYCEDNGRPAISRHFLQWLSFSFTKKPLRPRDGAGLHLQYRAQI